MAGRADADAVRRFSSRGLLARPPAWDNGSEFAKHEPIDLALEAKSYFADPYSSWQRGTNENGHGLIRQYCPKGCGLSTFDDAFIQAVEDKLIHDAAKNRFAVWSEYC